MSSPDAKSQKQSVKESIIGYIVNVPVVDLFVVQESNADDEFLLFTSQ